MKMSGERLRLNEKLTNVDSNRELELLVSKTIATIDWSYVINRVATPELQWKCHTKLPALNKKCQPKRPMNPFMLWTQAIRRKLSEQYSNIRNAQLSKTLGRMWSNMDYELRRPYLEEAERIRLIHKINYPNYRYQPRRRAKRAVAKPKRFSGISNHGIHYESNNVMRQSHDKNEPIYGHSEGRDSQLSNHRMRVNDSYMKPTPESVVIHGSPWIADGNEIDEIHCAGSYPDYISHFENRNELGSVLDRQREYQDVPISCYVGFGWDSQRSDANYHGEPQNDNTMIKQCGYTLENPAQSNVDSLVYSYHDESGYHNRPTSGTIQKCINSQNNVLMMKTPYAIECSNGDYRGQIMDDHQQHHLSRPITNH